MDKGLSFSNYPSFILRSSVAMTFFYPILSPIYVGLEVNIETDLVVQVLLIFSA